MDRPLDALIKLAKFVGVIVVPVTVWFLVLRQEVQSAKAAISDIQQVQAVRDQRYLELRDKIEQQYGILIRELGEIRGELKRIKQ